MNILERCQYLKNKKQIPPRLKSLLEYETNLLHRSSGILLQIKRYKRVQRSRYALQYIPSEMHDESPRCDQKTRV